ncbi:unnamed protein product [Meloidogyne enterolobii]|uniref:Uncharacterized protein n=1 Tax=Meloidogyne enterolobii TaxID=390850 RepID=A0ACB0YNU4_MELEN
MIKILFNFLFLIFILELFINYLIFGVNANKHRHHKIRHSRSPSPTFSHLLSSSTPTDFQFTAPFYNLSIFENSVGQRANIALNPSNAQMVGCWLPKGYNQIQFRITQGDEQNRFGVKSQRLGNFAFLLLEYKDQMDVLNRELQPEFNLIILATTKRRRGLALESIAKINIRVLDENDNPPMFKELNYFLNLNILPLPLNSKIIKLEAFDADEGLNGELLYSLIKPSKYFYIEQTTGWLRTFASLDSLKLPTNITLEVKIEDRASRLQNSNKELNSFSSPNLFNIRNKAFVEIQILDGNEMLKQPKIIFRQIHFQPILEHPVPVALIELFDKDLQNKENINIQLSRLNTQFIWNCAWIERINLIQFALNICPQFPRDILGLEETLTVRISVSRQIDLLNGKSITFGDQEFQIKIDPSIGRKITLNAGKYVGDNLIINLNESMPVGSVLWQFQAEINNLSNNYLVDKGKIRFKLLRHQQQQKFPFDLDQLTGQLKLISSLDYENPLHQKQFNFSIVAQLELGNSKKSLKLQSTPLEIKINLLDFNDNCPEFLEIPLNNLIIIEEKHLRPLTSSDNIIWKAKARDLDEGKNSEIIYKIIGDNWQLFDLHPFIGELRLIKEWPNSQQQINIKILAMDRGWPFSHQTQLPLIIKKDDGKEISVSPEIIQNTCQMPNKFAPEFLIKENEIIGEIEENAEQNTTIGYIKAKDEDFGINGYIQYFLISSTNNSKINSFIGIEPNNGRIFLLFSLNGKLGGNEGNNFDFPIQILAIDMAVNKEKQRGTKKEFKIRVKPGRRNEHSPLFEHYSYRIAIREENAPGTELLQLKAFDPDLGDNGRIEYKLIENNEINKLISVNSQNGLIKAIKSLDREVLGDLITFNGISLDNNLNNFFKVLASDFGIPQRQTLTNITLILDDINDQHPECSREIEQFYILEDSPNGQLVGCIGAFDKDLQKNSEIIYILMSDKNKNKNKILPFRLDEDSGCLFVDLEQQQTLNFEKQKEYQFNIKLKDKGTPTLESLINCLVKINLIKVFDNSKLNKPKFSEIALEANIEENSPIGTEILRLNAEIEEEKEGIIKGKRKRRQHKIKKEINYKLVGGNGFGFFEINSKNGSLKTLKGYLEERKNNNFFLENLELDFEDRQQFWLTIRAEYLNNLKQQQTHQHILIKILNQNDRLPLFSMPLYKAIINENCEENKVVLKVEATDADEQSINKLEKIIKYSIINEQQNFVIDENTGHILTGKNKLDREIQSEYLLTIRACDLGLLCSTSIVQINLEDENDNFPIFDLKYLSSLTAPANTLGFLGRVYAIDKDFGINSKIKYWIEPKNEKIEIDVNGRIFAKIPLKAGTLVEFVVFAEDGGNPKLKGNASVKMPVLERASRLSASNRAPFLTNPEKWREIILTGFESLGSVIGTIKAKDEDDDPLWWSIEDENGEEDSLAQKFFALRNVKEGAELILIENIQELNNIQEIIVKFSLSDGVDTIHDKLIIRLEYSKENIKFFEEEINLQIFNEMPIGYILYKPQLINNNKISTKYLIHYFLHLIDDINGFDVFRVDPINGNVILAKQLPQRLASPFTLIIGATIYSQHQKYNISGFSTLRINRGEENENSPMFIECYGKEEGYLEILLEGDGNPGDLIYTFEAVDPDRGNSGKVKYSLIYEQKKYQKLISLDETTGELRLLKGWPKKLEEVNLLIRATDSGNFPRSSDCHLNLLAPKSLIISNQFQPKYLNYSINNFKKYFGKLNSLIYSPKILNYLNIEENEEIKNKKENNYLIDTSNYYYKIEEKGECQQLLSIHFSNGKLVFNGAYTGLNELNCSIYLNSRENDKNNILIYNIFVNLNSTFSFPFISTFNETFDNNNLNSLLLNEEISTSTTLSTLSINNEKEIQFLPSSEIYFEQFLLENNLESSSIFSFPQQIYNLNIPEGRPLINQTILLSLWPLQNNLFGNKLKFKLIFNKFEEIILERFFKLDKDFGILWLIDDGNPMPKILFDREEQPQILMAIKVFDEVKNLSALCLVKINLEDINDNPPIFSEQKYLINVFEDAQIGDQILQLNAKDADSGINGMVNYELEDEASIPSFIQLNKSDGRLLISSSISRKEKQQKIFNFNVFAIDKGIPSLSSLPIQINLKIVDAQIPIFSAKIYRVEMAEMTEKKIYPSPLLQLKAEIPNKNLSKICYKIKNAKISNGLLNNEEDGGEEEEEYLKLFNLDLDSGLLFILNSLPTSNNSKQLFINLTVEAFVETSKNSGIANVLVRLPQKLIPTISFKYPIFKWNIFENSSVGTFIGKLELLNNNNPSLPVNYSLLINKNQRKIPSIISIHPTNGEVYLANLIEEKQKIYEFNVLALIKLENGNVESCEGLIQINVIFGGKGGEEEKSKEKDEKFSVANQNQFNLNSNRELTTPIPPTFKPEERIIKTKENFVENNFLLNNFVRRPPPPPSIQQNISKILKKEETNIKNGQVLNEILLNTNNNNNDWLQQFVDSNRLILLLLPTCLLSLALISFSFFICCRYCQRKNKNNLNNRKQRKSIKNKRNFGGGGTTTYSGSFTRGTIEFPSRRQTPDPACNPLVPRKTTASQVIADQQPPPPRPPRYRRDAHGTAALPTVEVKPMHRIQQNKVENFILKIF